MVTKYCNQCGKELIFKDSSLRLGLPYVSQRPIYDEKTGKPIPTFCPSGKCGHAGIEHDFEIKEGWFHKTYVCKNCGYRRPFSYPE